MLLPLPNLPPARSQSRSPQPPPVRRPPALVMLEYTRLPEPTNLLFEDLLRLPTPTVAPRFERHSPFAKTLPLSVSRFSSPPQPHFPVLEVPKSRERTEPRPQRTLSEYTPGGVLTFGEDPVRTVLDYGRVVLDYERVALDTALAPLLASPLEEPVPAFPSNETYTTASTTAEFTWQVVRELGTGSFSRVVLASSPPLPPMALKITNFPEDRTQHLQHATAASRELELLKSLRHPGVMQIHSALLNDHRSVVAMPFCRGGSLFQLATEHPLLPAPLVRRLFGQLAEAVAYLHRNACVHRDIKLENILVNHPWEELVAGPAGPVVTLGDFGLARRIDVESPLLTTRCGSDDYVAPEILMGLPYDGRSTDTWLCGVVLYLLLENRLPFDPIPVVNSAGVVVALNRRARARSTHRIARIEWEWWAHRGTPEPQWAPAMEIVANTLTRREKRWSSQQVVGCDWVLAHTW